MLTQCFLSTLRVLQIPEEDQASMMAPTAQKDQDFNTGSQMGELSLRDFLQVERGAQV